MELVITAFYVWFIWLIWYKYKLLKPNIVWKVTWPSLLVSALALELICLGQFCPYAEKSFVTTYVYQMAPEYGGMVKEVYAKPNVPIKKGDKLYQMDTTQWQASVDNSAAALAAAKQRVKQGDTAEVMLKLYPSKIFEAEVLDVIWATGEAQLTPTANLPSLASLGGGEFGGNFYAVKLGLKDLPEGFSPRFGASGRSAIYPKSAPAFLVLLRKLEIRMDSWVSYLYR